MSENNTPAGNSAVPEVHTVDSVLSTIGHEGFVRALFNRTGDPSKDFAHAALGIATEIFELRAAFDRKNQTEEAGDLVFYGHALTQVVVDYSLTTDNPTYKELVAASLCEFSDAQISSKKDFIDKLLNGLLDDAKRWVGYGRAPENLVFSLARGTIAVGLALEDSECAESGELERVNIAKLLERYKGLTFTANAAINRDVVKERQVMEDAGA